ELLKELKAVPVKVEDGRLLLAMADPRDLSAVEIVEKITGYEVVPLLAFEDRVLEAITRVYEGKKSQVDDIVSSINGIEVVEDNVEYLKDIASEAPIIRLVNIIINRAVEKGASDIHIEPFEKEVKVRYRIDGVLHEVETLPKNALPGIVSRIKIMAKLDIAEKRLPQDGRIKLKIEGKDIDIRVATLPTLFGEEVVMRLLDRSSILLSLEDLGFSKDVFDKFVRLITSSYGMILVTGPTGSGKTTTLYASLNRINTPDKKIITIEDPVEYQLEGINQIQVNPAIGLTFASGLRSIVRQDPDIVMVGEIRDIETAEIAIQAALTGHLVFSTLHTNDAASAITRLIDMGVEDYLVASSVIGILAQRLVRKLCPHCKKKIAVSDYMRRVFEEHGMAERLDKGEIYAAEGCAECDYTGYKGRMGIFELLVVDDDIRALISKGVDSETIKKKAISKGMRTLIEDGLDKVASGVTTLEEVLRVAQKGII
ncbi:MAG: type II secretion system ATPase GspE, partial [Deferribacteres bacterium]|nr:type II secretion system ATPase GspE [Deferribacteres bacterium]